jgi:hypothetical protein
MSLQYILLRRLHGRGLRRDELDDHYFRGSNATDICGFTLNKVLARFVGSFYFLH